MLGGRGLGRLFHGPPQFGPDLCREQGGVPLPINWQARVGGAAECDYWTVQVTPELLYCENSGPVPYIKGGGNCTLGKGGSTEKGGGREDGEGDEGGEEGRLRACSFDLGT